MENQIKQYLGSVRLGQPQTHHNLILFPLQAAQNGVMPFITLGEATASGTLTVSEVSTGGSVPELFVINKGQDAVLLVDGEELIGAKQNRVLNTSILIMPKSEVKIPVSCVEQGRWSYKSLHFSPSEAIMAVKSRAQKSRSVSASLKNHASFGSDQGQVWEEIHKLQSKACMESPTSAMNDVFSAYDQKLKECLAKFPCDPGQQGLLVLHNGQVAGLDLISRPEAYARLHDKFVRSYILEALMEKPGETADLDRARETGMKFLADASAAAEERFPSTGFGWDHRLRADGLAGNALAAHDHVIHMAIFKLEPTKPEPENMASVNRRRSRFMRE